MGDFLYQISTSLEELLNIIKNDFPLINSLSIDAKISILPVILLIISFIWFMIKNWSGILMFFRGSISLKKIELQNNSFIDYGEDKYVIVELSCRNKHRYQMCTITQFNLKAINPKNLKLKFARVTKGELGVCIENHTAYSEEIIERFSGFFNLSNKKIQINPGQEYITKFCVKIDNLTLPSKFKIVLKDTSNKEYGCKISLKEINGKIVMK